MKDRKKLWCVCTVVLIKYVTTLRERIDEIECTVIWYKKKGRIFYINQAQQERVKKEIDIKKSQKCSSPL